MSGDEVPGKLPFGRRIAAATPPDGAALAALDRDILFRATVDPSGRVREVELLRGARPDLDRAYRRYLRSFRFEPATTADGEPLEVELLVRFAPARRPTAEAPVLPGQAGVSPPDLVDHIQPVYPEPARDARIEGQVILRAVIDRDGWVRDIQVLRAAPSHVGFSREAIAAVSGWRYRPAMRGGEPVEALFTMNVRFTLGDEKPSRQAVR